MKRDCEDNGKLCIECKHYHSYYGCLYIISTGREDRHFEQKESKKFVQNVHWFISYNML